jgi:hypothetical protein
VTGEVAEHGFEFCDRGGELSPLQEGKRPRHGGLCGFGLGQAGPQPRQAVVQLLVEIDELGETHAVVDHGDRVLVGGRTEQRQHGRLERPDLGELAANPVSGLIPIPLERAKDPLELVPHLREVLKALRRILPEGPLDDGGQLGRHRGLHLGEGWGGRLEWICSSSSMGSCRSNAGLGHDVGRFAAGGIRVVRLFWRGSPAVGSGR